MQESAWTEHFHADLQPHVHFVPIKHDLSDLVDRFNWLETHPAEAERLAAAALAFGNKQLRSLHTECYALAAMRVVSAAQAFKPENLEELQSQGFLTDSSKRSRSDL